MKRSHLERDAAPNGALPNGSRAQQRQDHTARIPSREHLPRNPKTGAPILPMAQPGYYPGYHTLSQQAFWDEATRAVVLKRVNDVPPIRFFTPLEYAVMVAVTNRILPQDDRDDAHKIPLVPFLDKKLYEDTISGYRYENMPPQREAYRLFIQGAQAIAFHLYDRPFQELRAEQQDYVLQTIHDEAPPAGGEYWSQMSLLRMWQALVNDTVHVYYAHPYAWDEIGFGGPAYPRGYMRLHRGEPEPWEVKERRYEWDAPPNALSDTYKPIGNESPLDEELHSQSSLGGAGGTH
ncbi:MAG: gluconate 2-dehydrogenase subunit 3 family protein [Ktedonobacterales bacterium]